MLRTILALAILAGAASQLVAQDFPAPAKPTQEHQWLKQLVGEWDTDNEATFGEQKVACTGTQSSRMLGDYWVLNEGEMTPMGMVMKSLQAIGYDPARKKFVGTFISSADGTFWIYEGTLDKAGRKLTLEADGPNMLTGKTTKFRDSYEIKSPDHVAMTGEMLGDDGKWVTFMTGNSKRKN
jgi:hypothetical protein